MMTKSVFIILIVAVTIAISLFSLNGTRSTSAQSTLPVEVNYFDDFSSYSIGSPPSGWLLRGANEVTPTIKEVGGSGPSYQLLDFPEIPWQYTDRWLLKEGLNLSSLYTVTLKLNFQNNVADRAGLTIAWNDTTSNRVDIQPNVYGNGIEFRVTYNGPVQSNVVINNINNSIPINAFTNYWLRVVVKNYGLGQGQIFVFWSTNNTSFTQVITATGLQDLTGLVGISTAGPHLPHMYFDDFSVVVANFDATPEPIEPTPASTLSPIPTLTPTPTPSPTPPTEQVVVFIPGIGGSELAVMDDEQITEYLWPGQENKPWFWNRDSLHRRLTLDLTKVPENIAAIDAIRNVNVGIAPDQSVYDQLIKMFIDKRYKEYIVGTDIKKRTDTYCDISQEDDGTKPNLFVFGYDWRYGMVNGDENHPQLEMTNPQLLKEYIACVSKFHPETDITIVAHSMGGMVAWQYLLENSSDNPINRLITIGTPWLGAPKAISSLLTGNFSYHAVELMTAKELLQYFPGSHQLLPSEAYWQVGGSPIGRSQAFTSNLQEVPFSEYNQFLQSLYGSDKVDFVSNSILLHGQAGFDDWRNITLPVDEVYILYGEGVFADTMGLVTELRWTTCWKNEEGTVICTDSHYPSISRTMGDKTVPVFSSSRQGNGIDLNHPNTHLYKFKDRDPVVFLGETVEHLALTKNQRVQNCILSIIDLTNNACQHDSVQPSVQAAAQKNNVQARYIDLWGVESVVVSNGISVTSEIMTDTIFSELPGFSYDKLGADAVSMVFSPSQTYTITIVAGDLLLSEVKLGTGDSKQEEIRYLDQMAVPGGKVQLVLSGKQLAHAQYDRNGDGYYEMVLEPTSHVVGVVQDTVPPQIKFQVSGNTLVISAEDVESGVSWVKYSTDGTVFLTYSEPFTVEPGQVIYAFTQDIVGNRSLIKEHQISQQSTHSLYLPLIQR